MRHFNGSRIGRNMHCVNKCDSFEILFTDKVIDTISPNFKYFLRLLAKLDYIQGSHTEAIEKQHKVS